MAIAWAEALSAHLYNHQTHRARIANLLKSCLYYITNDAKADLPGLIAEEHEIGYRYFKGAAAGNVLIGEPPQGDLFKHYFDWEDAIFRWIFISLVWPM